MSARRLLVTGSRDWAALGDAAGPIRNQHMVDLGANSCLAFLLPGSRGSLICAEMARNAGIPVHRIHQEGVST